MADTHPFTVTQVARAAGVSPSKVRYYDDHGLLDGVRTPGNQRRFTPGDSCRVQIVALGHSVGLSLRDLATLFAALPAVPTTQDWAVVTTAIRRAADERRRSLEQVLLDLERGDPLCQLAPAAAADAHESTPATRG